MVAEDVRAFEVYVGEEALMVGEASAAEGDLLNAIGDCHVKDALRAALDVISHHDVVAQVPYFEVVSASSE